MSKKTHAGTQQIFMEIEEFLKENRKAGLSGSDMTPLDLEQFEHILELLIVAKFGKVYGRDYPIEVKVIDRKHCWPLHYEPLRYTHDLETEEQFEHTFDRAMMNLSLAMTDVQNLQRVRRG